MNIGISRATQESSGASIKPYWDFVRNDANRGKSVVKITSNKLGIAVPLGINEDRITFINKNGAEALSDETTKIVNHFKEALAHKYGGNFAVHLFSSNDTQHALANGLSYHMVSKAYERACVADISDMLKKIEVCSKAAEKLSVGIAREANLINAKQDALEARKQVKRAQNLFIRLKAVATLYPNNMELLKTVTKAKVSVSSAVAAAQDAANVIDRNHRLLGGPSLDLIDFPEEGHGTWRDIPDSSSQEDASTLSSVSTLQEIVETDEQKAARLKNDARVAHDAILQKLDQKKASNR